jgi:hypothetical protein
MADLRVALSPFTPGIAMSITTTSGLSSSTRTSAGAISGFTDDFDI